MDRHVNAISSRLSLRAPQRDALEILSHVTQLAPPAKDADLDAVLQAIQAEYPSVEDFERDFPSLCFALATGVGKTRLMGAFVTYLYRAKGIRHFFVLAPNLTIYSKLIADFTPNTPKYVFQGISEFATNPPLIITGDNYERGHGVRAGARPQLGFFDEDVHINIFNISKINTEVRGGRSPRIKRLSEYIGDSYFDYLAGLEDLVLLMDESHRYRASAGIRAINELKPILGLELTATPQVETGNKAIPFKNVIFSYPLHQALADGFVKEPAVATREDFDASALAPEQLERLKLEDGVRVHEAVKVDLEVYARQNNLPIVKPFMLVIAQDTTHANALVEQIKNPAFFEGRYADRVIQVHSQTSGEERDETVQRLLAVESPDEPTEIVIHVNMLKEGWDVTNLFTIVPLRAANSRTLIEQSIGRGLRLPYGRRVGVPAVDRLTIVAHDKFQEIIDEANKGNSIIRTGVIIGRDIPLARQRTVVVRPKIETQLFGGDSVVPGAKPTYAEPRERAVATAALAAIRNLERLPSSRGLLGEDIQQRIVEQIAIELAPAQYALPLSEYPETEVDVASVVNDVATAYIASTIDIPRIVIVPRGEVAFGFDTFTLDLRNVRYQPVEQTILIQHLRTHQRDRLAMVDDGVVEQRLEDYVVRKLIDFNDVSYDDHADLLYDLAGQVVQHLRTYLSDDGDIRNVLRYYQEAIGDLIHAQMQQHRWETATEYDAEVKHGFTRLDAEAFSAPADEQPRNFRTPVADRSHITSMLFGGFTKCLYPIQKFSTDTERRFAVVLENDSTVLKWVKPARTAFRIFLRDGRNYEPDFVVETEDRKFICEPKRRNDMNDDDVKLKAKAAIEWCLHASEHELQHGGKPWVYLLIPHDAINEAMTLSGLAAQYEYSVPVAV